MRLKLTILLITIVVLFFILAFFWLPASQGVFAIDRRVKMNLDEIVKLSNEVSQKQSISQDALEVVYHDYDILAQKAFDQQLSKDEKTFLQSAFFILSFSTDRFTGERLVKLLGNKNFSQPIHGNGIILALERNEQTHALAIPALIALAEKYPQFKETIILSFWSYKNAPDAYVYIARNVNSSDLSHLSRQGMYYITGDKAWAIDDGIIPQSLIDDFISNPAKTCKLIPEADGTYPVVPWH